MTEKLKDPTTCDPSPARRWLNVPATATLLYLTVCSMVACTPSLPSTNDVSAARGLVESCRGRVDVFTAIDATASARAAGLDAARRRAVRSDLALVAACGGVGKVQAFSSSAVASVTLFEGTIPLAGATAQAKALRLDKAVDTVLDQVTAKFEREAPGLDGQGSDPVAQLGASAEWRRLKNSPSFQVDLLTDGLQNKGVSVSEIVTQPVAAAGRFSVPDLSGAKVTFAGIGVTDGSALPTSEVDGLKRFYQVLCERSQASTCMVVSEPAGTVK